ncbi:hypothetical protein [Leptothoe kymatousa]|uniref:Uncharacterized protein n=1 Tax=Leptothoe kymatousa TAU-MAC 1615 TaxID=2364775 RepID=A0ABS5Y626_9CYAN|nr:hypothetical protein [Leptothoe kymatousa]MBT9313309.1 hypothetical protein [Leptothoe kymatousa TAU-MAC 1615]
MNQRIVGQETLNYRLRPNHSGVCLDLWENDPDASPGEASFRFFVTYDLKSTADAQAILDNYLVTNRMDQAIPSADQEVTPLHLSTLVGSTAVVQ